MSGENGRTWIITGASSGLGRALAEAALEAGECVVGTARRLERFASLRQRYGDQFVAVAHDVTDTDGAADVISAALEAFGRVDVLVNNAGAGQLGAAEEVTDTQLRTMLDQHLHGPAALVRAVLPHMRLAGAGSIVQMSSQGGRMSFPGVGSYSAGKFALEGWSEALAGEVAPYGIRVLIAEPSRFRTEFNSDEVLLRATEHGEYDSVIGGVRIDLTSAEGKQEGDPARAARIIRRMLEGADAPLRLPLGTEAVRNLVRTYERELESVRQWDQLSESADFPDVLPNERDLTPSAS